MTVKQTIFFLSFISPLILFASCQHVHAQQSAVDSIITSLNKSKTATGVDTATFSAATNRIQSIQLNDTFITQLEKAGDVLNNRPNEYFSYQVRFYIFYNLISTDKDKAIAYGKYNCEKLEKNRTTPASDFRSDFLRELRLPYRNSNRLDEGFQYFNDKLKEYKLNSDTAGLMDCYYVLSGFYRAKGLLDQAIYNMKKSFSYLDTLTEKGRNGRMNYIEVLGFFYLQNGDYYQSQNYSTRAIYEYKMRRDSLSFAFPAMNIALAKLMSGQSDSVAYYLDIAINLSEKRKNYDNLACALQVQALYKIKTGALDEAETILGNCWKLVEENQIPENPSSGTVAPDYYFALLRIKQNRSTDAIALLIKDIERLNNQRLDKLRDYKLLAELYEKSGNSEKAKDAYKKFISLQDNLLADQKKYRSLSFETEQQMSENEANMLKLKNENKIASLSRNYSVGIAVLLLLIAIGIYMRFRSKKTANAKLERAYNDLKNTQQQLIQSEKLAAFGTIATRMTHEILNPLNFVNNFSELSSDLVHEIALSKDENEKANVVKSLLENLEKINHHGRRASTIVSQLQQHSNRGTVHEFFYE